LVEPRGPQSARRRSRLDNTVRVLIRTRITTGLIIVLPVLVTLWVLRIVFYWLRDASLWVVVGVLESRTMQQYVWQGYLADGELDPYLTVARPGEPPHLDLAAFLHAHPWLDWGIDLFSVLLTFFLLYLIGLFAANIFGRRLINVFDAFIERVPIVKTIYRATKQILASFAGDQTQSFQRVAIIPFPQEKMRCVGFITNVFTDSVTGEELCTVFIPTTPNPTTGYLQILRRGDITELDWSVEEAIRTIMSGGILKPDYLTIVPNKLLPDDVPPGIGPSEAVQPVDIPPAKAAPPP
jgi:uncharacterized membrane protein